VGLEVSGTAFSGMGKGKYYVGLPEYQRRFEAALGYRPYPGTLNVKLSDRKVIERLGELRRSGGTKIPGFTLEGEQFSSLTCVDGTLADERITLLFIDITHYNETVAELISPVYLRGKLGIRDGDEIRFRLASPGRL
jgi:riboflavin kinase, archaea type